MAFAPAAIGLGSSLFSGLGGKKSAKKQQKLAEQQFAALKPLLDAQVAGSKFALDQSKPFLAGAGEGIKDLQNFWNPLVHGDRSAIDQFLAPERRAINQGYQASLDMLSRGPRGGGRTAALNQANLARQGQLSDLIFGARKQGAGQLEQLAALLGQLGTSTLSAGIGGGQQSTSLYNAQANRAYDAQNQAGAGLGQVGSALGQLLGSLNFGGGKSGGPKSSTNMLGKG